MKPRRSMPLLGRFRVRRGPTLHARRRRTAALIWRSRGHPLVLERPRLLALLRSAPHRQQRLVLRLRLHLTVPPSLLPRAPFRPATTIIRSHAHHHRRTHNLRLHQRLSMARLYSERHSHLRDIRTLVSQIRVLHSQERHPRPSPLAWSPARPGVTHLEHSAITRSMLRIGERLAWRSARSPAAAAAAVHAPATTATRNPPPLVWRTEGRPDQLVAAAGNMSALAAAAPTAVTRAIPLEQLQIGPATQASRIADPALVDRVANEVIGRVERRFRIERERRGA